MKNLNFIIKYTSAKELSDVKEWFLKNFNISKIIKIIDDVKCLFVEDFSKNNYAMGYNHGHFCRFRLDENYNVLEFYGSPPITLTLAQAQERYGKKPEAKLSPYAANLNFVILCESNEHGKKIDKWFLENFSEQKTFRKLSFTADGKYVYYGFVNGQFGAYAVLKDGVEILTLAQAQERYGKKTEINPEKSNFEEGDYVPCDSFKECADILSLAERNGYKVISDGFNENSRFITEPIIVFTNGVLRTNYSSVTKQPVSKYDFIKRILLPNVNKPNTLKDFCRSQNVPENGMFDWLLIKMFVEFETKEHKGCVKKQFKTTFNPYLNFIILSKNAAEKIEIKRWFIKTFPQHKECENNYHTEGRNGGENGFYFGVYGSYNIDAVNKYGKEPHTEILTFEEAQKYYGKVETPKFDYENAFLRTLRLFGCSKLYTGLNCGCNYRDGNLNNNNHK